MPYFSLHLWNGDSGRKIFLKSSEIAKKWYVVYAVNTVVLSQMPWHLLNILQGLEQSYLDFEQCNKTFFHL